MKFALAPALLASLLAASACGGQGDDTLGDQAADRADQRADRLEEQAEDIREAGEAREEAIDEADVKADELSPEQKEALVNGQ